MLNALVLAGSASRAKDGSSIEIIDGVWLLCEESGWQVARAQIPMSGAAAGWRCPIPGRPVVDLFARGDGGATGRCCCNYLAPCWNVSAPGIVARGRWGTGASAGQALSRPAFLVDGPGQRAHEQLGRPGARRTSCSPCSAAGPHRQEIRRAVVIKAAGSLDAFLKGLWRRRARARRACSITATRDFACSMRCWSWTRVAPGCFAPLWKEPKLRNIAEYIVHMHVDGRRYFNFADSSAVVERCGALRVPVWSGKPARRCWRISPPPTGPRNGRRPSPRRSISFIASRPPSPPRCWRRIGGGSVTQAGRFPPEHRPFRCTRRALRAGGQGSETMATVTITTMWGSVILYKDGRPILIDVGVETYTARNILAAAIRDLDDAVGLSQSADIRRRDADRGRGVRGAKRRRRSGRELGIDRDGDRRGVSARSRAAILSATGAALEGSARHHRRSPRWRQAGHAGP